MYLQQGTKLKFGFENYNSLKATQNNFNKFYFDINHYQKIHKEITLASKLYYGNFFGNNPKYFLLGGVKNSLFSKKEENAKYDPLSISSGIDNSNVKGDENICLLPKNPDLSCKKIKDKIKKQFDKNVSVIMTDTFGRPWRMGQTNIAIGIAGMNPFQNYVGKKDIFNKTLKHTMICIADEIASAAELIMGKTNMIPVAIVKGYKYDKNNDSRNNIIREKDFDLFR